jgi:hypothetical protein
VASSGVMFVLGLIKICSANVRTKAGRTARHMVIPICILVLRAVQRTHNDNRLGGKVLYCRLI